MLVRAIMFASAIIAGMTLSAGAKADGGWATTAVNMRTCGSVRCPVILTIPAGAPVRLYDCDSWCDVEYEDRRGMVYGRYIAERHLSRGIVLTPRMGPPPGGGPIGITQSTGYLVSRGIILTPRMGPPPGGGPIGIQTY
jgi:uncharacterized protein YraI